MHALHEHTAFLVLLFSTLCMRVFSTRQKSLGETTVYYCTELTLQLAHCRCSTGAFQESNKQMENIHQVSRSCRLIRERLPELQELEGWTSSCLWVSPARLLHVSVTPSPAKPSVTFHSRKCPVFPFHCSGPGCFPAPFAIHLGPSEQIDG